MKKIGIGSQIILAEIETLKERVISAKANNLINCSVNNTAIIKDWFNYIKQLVVKRYN